MAILAFHDVSYQYEQGVPVLKKLSLAIKAGEKIAVLGHNGAGKTTFFQLCNGLLAPQTGYIEHHGRIVTRKRRDLVALRKEVCMVFQEADNQLIAPTVESEISFGPMNLGYHENEVRTLVEDVLATMQLTTLRDRPPHNLSGGEKKRVSIADALVMNPQILLMDEPTASLDPASALHFETLLTQLHQKGIALMIASHDVDFAWRWATRIVVLHQGEIIADDAPENVFAQADILRRANLRQPIFYEIQQLLAQERTARQEPALGFWIKTMADYRRYMKTRLTDCDDQTIQRTR